MIEDWKGNTAVITAVTRGYDYCGEQVRTPGVENIFFHDERTTPPSGWTNVLLPGQGLDSMRLAKLPKVVPHRFPVLKDFKYTIWIDGSMQITNKNFPSEILRDMENGMVISPHFDTRDCAYSEAQIRPPKYAKEPLDKQISHYRNEGFPEHFGLYEAGVSARELHNQEVIDMSEMWMEEILHWSIQDQVSFPYVLWKTGFKPDILEKSWRDYNWIHINAHKLDLNNG